MVLQSLVVLVGFSTCGDVWWGAYLAVFQQSSEVVETHVEDISAAACGVEEEGLADELIVLTQRVMDFLQGRLVILRSLQHPNHTSPQPHICGTTLQHSVNSLQESRSGACKGWG